MVTQLMQEKYLTKIICPSIMKTLSNLGIKGEFSARWKSIYEKPTTSVLLKVERLDVCP